MADFALSSSQTISRYRVATVHVDVVNQVISFHLDFGSGTGSGFSTIRNINGIIIGNDWDIYIGANADGTKSIGANVHNTIKQFCIDKGLV